jgi:hypothetical protein
MTSRQADFFGFPNSWIGLFGFGLVVVVGFGLLAAAQFKRWFWVLFEVGLSLAIIFAYWLLFQSIYVVKALCPFCLTVDVVLTIMFWYISLWIVGVTYNQLPKPLQALAANTRHYHLEILVTWFLVIFALILQHFWYYYGQFIKL